MLSNFWNPLCFDVFERLAISAIKAHDEDTAKMGQNARPRQKAPRACTNSVCG